MNYTFGFCILAVVFGYGCFHFFRQRVMRCNKDKIEIPVFLRNDGNLVNDSGSVNEGNPTIICRPRKG